MKHRSTQLVARKNPDSPRVHGLRLAANPQPSKGYLPSASENEEAPPIVPTGGVLQLSRSEKVKESSPEGQLLTVQEVAKLLHVPASWVYGRTRKRSLERLPGYRLGKYWRFREEEILVWVQRQRGGYHAA